MIDVEVELTANHRGHFQLKICPVGRGEADATQAMPPGFWGYLFEIFVYTIVIKVLL